MDNKMVATGTSSNELMWIRVHNFLDTMALKIFLDTNHYFNPRRPDMGPDIHSILAEFKTISKYIEAHTTRILNDKLFSDLDAMHMHGYMEHVDELFILMVINTFPCVINVSTDDYYVIYDSFRKFIAIL
jgi:hypothetical protein